MFKVRERERQREIVMINDLLPTQKILKPDWAYQVQGYVINLSTIFSTNGNNIHSIQTNFTIFFTIINIFFLRKQSKDNNWVDKFLFRSIINITFYRPLKIHVNIKCFVNFFYICWFSHIYNCLKRVDGSHL